MFNLVQLIMLQESTEDLWQKVDEREEILGELICIHLECIQYFFPPLSSRILFVVAIVALGIWFPDFHLLVVSVPIDSLPLPFSSRPVYSLNCLFCSVQDYNCWSLVRPSFSIPVLTVECPLKNNGHTCIGSL